MADQHKYTSNEFIKRNAARVQRIVLIPNADPTGGVQRLGIVEVLFELGEEVSGVYTVKETKALRLEYHQLNSALRDTLDDLEDKALAAGETQGIFPAGANEPIPIP